MRYTDGTTEHLRVSFAGRFLTDGAEGDATRVHACVEVPEHWRELGDGYRAKIPASLQRLRALCQRSA